MAGVRYGANCHGRAEGMDGNGKDESEEAEPKLFAQKGVFAPKNDCGNQGADHRGRVRAFRKLTPRNSTRTDSSNKNKMPSKVISGNINTDLQALMRAANLPLFCATNLTDYRIDGGRGRFVSVMTPAHTVSMSYHTTRWHSATAQVPFGSEKGVSPPGRWVVTHVRRALMGNKTFYDWW